MSLSTFLRNYLYIPLGGNRRGNVRTYFNLFIVMFLGGLWHGARWSYAIWGIWHGVWLMIERLLQNRAKNHPNRSSSVSNFFRMAFVFLIVTIGWLLFRLPNIFDAALYVQSVSMNWGRPIDFNTISGVLLFCIPVVIHHLLFFVPNDARFIRIFEVLQPVYFAVLIFLIFTANGDRYDFIYFQF